MAWSKSSSSPLPVDIMSSSESIATDEEASEPVIGVEGPSSVTWSVSASLTLLFLDCDCDWDCVSSMAFLFLVVGGVVTVSKPAPHVEGHRQTRWN